MSKDDPAYGTQASFVIHDMRGVPDGDQVPDSGKRADAMSQHITGTWLMVGFCVFWLLMSLFAIFKSPEQFWSIPSAFAFLSLALLLGQHARHCSRDGACGHINKPHKES